MSKTTIPNTTVTPAATPSPLSNLGLGLAREAETLVGLLDAAAQIALRYFQQPLAVEIKQDDTPVTRADTEIEACLRSSLAATHPNDGVYGEEEGLAGALDRLWVIDPIDGTQSFMHGNPLYGHLVAWLRDGVPVLGGLGFSALDEIWIAAAGGGAWRRKAGRWQQVRTRAARELSAAVLLCTNPSMIGPDEATAFEALRKQVRYLRYGGDCHIYATIAGGWADLAVESSLKPYDFLALAPLIGEAGGTITDWSGAPLTLDSGPRVIAAATADLHRSALSILSKT